MDGYEATRIVLSRIQNLEPENASKIMGLLLIQDHGEKEMIRLAFGPETLLHSVILKAKEELGFVPSRQNSSTSSRLIGTNGVNLPFLSIPTNPSTFSWNSDELMSPSLPFHGNGVSTSMLDEVQLNQDHDLFYPQAADACGADDSGSEFWWRPCLFYARGYCKNGNNCRFIHGEFPGAGADNITGSLDKIELMEQCHELLRSRSARQQRLAAASQLMASPTFPYSPKCMNLVNDSQRAAAAAALIVGDEYDMNKFNRSRLERNGFSIKGETGMVNPASRQIYLTFPADSSFREDDVSNYFSTYGPVQDVRIPYQQKRMFGFVTFLYAETVKIILAKGNPHFVCDARVLVKPYKEKGKIPDKYRQPQMERGEFSPCGTPTGLDSRDPFDLQLGARMFYNNQDLLWRRKIGEQNDLQQALELQNRRLMSLQLLDVKKHQHQRVLSSGSPIPSPSHSPSLYGQSLVLTSSRETPQENCSSPMPAILVATPEKQTAGTATVASTEENGCDKESPHCEDSALTESLEHNLPDSPFASPAKATGEHSAFSNVVAEKDASDNNWIDSNNALDMSSINSFNCQLPRLSSGHGTIGMYAGSGGPTCPVGI